jgi:hypothetical protein
MITTKEKLEHLMKIAEDAAKYERPMEIKLMKGVSPGITRSLFGQKAFYSINSPDIRKIPLNLYQKEYEEFKKNMESPSLVVHKGAACGRSTDIEQLANIYSEKELKKMKDKAILQQHAGRAYLLNCCDPLTEEESEAIRNQPTCHNCGSIDFLPSGTCKVCAVCGESLGACG